MADQGALQEFMAGAHPAQKELVLRMADGERLLLVAVDETRQRRLADLFARLDPRADETPKEVTARWRVLHLGGRPRAVRLDLVFRRPLRLQVRVLFSVATSVAVRNAPDAAHLCLVSRAAFGQLERSGVCGSQAIVLPTPPTGELEAALAAA
jgi:uncharacterized membrane protein